MYLSSLYCILCALVPSLPTHAPPQIPYSRYQQNVFIL